jgi:hypothetical protein
MALIKRKLTSTRQPANEQLYFETFKKKFLECNKIDFLIVEKTIFFPILPHQQGQIRGAPQPKIQIKCTNIVCPETNQ